MATTKLKALPTCPEVPEFERLNYFYGQMLSAKDFRSEQAYFRDKMRLHNRCHHGWGVVCGLHVTPVPVDEPCLPEEYCGWQELCEEIESLDAEIQSSQDAIDSGSLSDEELEQAQQKLTELKARREELQRRKDCTPPSQQLPPEQTRLVQINCGVALDCHGNDLVVREPLTVDIAKLLGANEQRHCAEQGEPVNVYLSLCYCEQPTHPSRPVIPDSCGSLAECNYGKYRESIRVTASLEPPGEDARCGGCCDPCPDDCVLLACISWHPDQVLTADDIDCGVRRPISVYHPTVITAISWQHGATYSPSFAKKVLGTEHQGTRTDGLEIHFSRPVFTDTIKPGVFDVWRIQGGSGLRGVISNMESSVVPIGDDETTVIHIQDNTGETLNSEDRVLITIRCNFILDCCCQPVDGFHVGGRIPQLPDYALEDPNGEPPTPDVCLLPPGGCGPWTSGNGHPAGTFESWFYVS